MSQEITDGSETYSRLKNIVIETISSSSSKSSLSNAHSRVFFDHFVDDDVDEVVTFERFLNFLHNHYFSRLAWARLTLNLKKCKFFVSRIQILEHQRDVIDIKSSKNKLKMFREWSSLTFKKELDRFLHMLSFLKNYILERADRTTLLKTTIIEKITSTIVNEKKRITRKIKNFLWISKHEIVFQNIKKTIVENVCSSEDDEVQWHLAIDASKTDVDEILFQLSNHSIDITMSKNTRDSLKIVMFLSFQFTDSQTRYQTTEREFLFVIKNLIEVRWLVQESKHSIKLYTNHQTLLKCF